MTAEDYAKDVAQKSKQRERENELGKLRIDQRKNRAKENPEFRSTEYLEFMRKGGLFPYPNRLHDNHIYVVELKERVAEDKKRAEHFFTWIR